MCSPFSHCPACLQGQTRTSALIPLAHSLSHLLRNLQYAALATDPSITFSSELLRDKSLLFSRCPLFVASPRIHCSVFAVSSFSLDSSGFSFPSGIAIEIALLFLAFSIGSGLSRSPFPRLPFREQVTSNQGMAERVHELEEGSYASQLHFAVKQNDVKRVRSLVEEDSTKVMSRDAVGRTPLHWALVFGNDEAAKVLVINMSRSSLDTRDQQGCTPLHYAAARAYTTMARVLIMRGASLNAADAKQRTPLHYAAQQTSPEMVELLVSRGADRARPNVQGELPVDVALKWGALSSIPCLTPDSASATTPAIDEQSVENLKNTTPVSSAPVEAKKKGPSLEKLLSAWKAAETETRRKKEAELAAAHKANVVLEEALRAWREIEQAINPQRHSKEVDSDSDIASTSMSCSKPVGFAGLSVDTGCGDENDFGSISCTQKRDLSWCTEWEAQENVPEEVAEAMSPRERKLTPNPWKEENMHPWVQVPTYKQTLDPNFDNPKVLRRANSFDGSHFIIHVGGLATKLPFMSSLEVY